MKTFKFTQKPNVLVYFRTWIGLNKKKCNLFVVDFSLGVFLSICVGVWIIILASDDSSSQLKRLVMSTNEMLQRAIKPTERRKKSSDDQIEKGKKKATDKPKCQNRKHSLRCNQFHLLMCIAIGERRIMQINPHSLKWLNVKLLWRELSHTLTRFLYGKTKRHNTTLLLLCSFFSVSLFLTFDDKSQYG